MQFSGFRLTIEKKIEERLCNYERYRCLAHNDFLGGITQSFYSLKNLRIWEKFTRLFCFFSHRGHGFKTDPNWWKIRRSRRAQAERGGRKGQKVSTLEDKLDKLCLNCLCCKFKIVGVKWSWFTISLGHLLVVAWCIQVVCSCISCLYHAVRHNHMWRCYSVAFCLPKIPETLDLSLNLVCYFKSKHNSE